jgi:hypothetical protein
MYSFGWLKFVVSAQMYFPLGAMLNCQKVLLHPLWDSFQYTRDLLSIGMKDYPPESKRASATFYNASLHYE